jgi:broad specificity polyphosphatase/5'/3'-nucleotidase SurE
VVPQSTEGIHEHYIEQKDEQGQTVFQLAGGLHRDQEGTADTIALAEGYITMTALAPDMTNHRKTDELKRIEW